VLNKEIPFLRIGLPFCIGILSGRYLKPSDAALVSLTVVSVALFLISIYFNKRQVNLVYGLAISLAMISTGASLYRMEKERLTDLKPVVSGFIGTVMEYPDEKGKISRLVVKLAFREENNVPEPVNGSLFINIRTAPIVRSLIPGDIIKLTCLPVEITNRGNPDEFDYRFYMENRGIRYSASAVEKDLIYVISPSHRKFSHRALIIRERIISMYEQRGIRGEQLALIAAITLGQKNLLEPEQKQDFMKAGIMHVMAVSGLHAVILSMFVFSLLFFLKGRLNIIRVGLTVIFLWLFAFITGLTPSVLRATIMFTFIQTGKIMKRNVNNVNSVLASALLLMAGKPSVLFDAGFLLSYSAVLFIICFYDRMYNLLDFKNRMADLIWQSVCVTLVAQLGTLPLTISLFNRFPVYFILTNTVIVPLTSLIIIISCLIPLTFPLKFISQPVALVLKMLTGFTGNLTGKAASLPMSSVNTFGMGPLESFLLFAFIFLILYYIFNRKSIKIFYPLLLLLAFSVASAIRDLSGLRTNELIVYNSPGSYTVGIKRGKYLDLYSDKSSPSPEAIRHCAMRNLKVRLKTVTGTVTAFKAGEKKIVITGHLNKYIIKEINPDIIVFYGKKPGLTEQGLSINAGTIVIYTWANSINTPGGKTFNNAAHSVRMAGAFRLKL